MYDAWSDDQRNAIMWSIINLGLQYGLDSYTNSADQERWDLGKGLYLNHAENA